MISTHSRRESRRRTIKDKEQKLRCLDRRQDSLKPRLGFGRTAKLIPLDKPILAGWKREHIIREDIAKSPVWGEDAKLVLPYLSRTVYSRRKDFQRKRNKSKLMEDIPHNLKGISKVRWEKDKLDKAWPSHLRMHFKLVTVGKTDPEHADGERQVYRFDRPWWFTHQTARYYFTHVRAIDGEAESEYEKIGQKLDREHYWKKRFGSGRSKEKEWNPYHAEQDPLNYTYWEEHTDRL